MFSAKQGNYHFYNVFGMTDNKYMQEKKHIDKNINSWLK